jgi:hypothetical protein
MHEAKGNVVSAQITRQKLEDNEALARRAGPTATQSEGGWRVER